MIIQLKNFGPIKSFSIDLEKDFHLLIGRNSIGKSYAITAIYLILKNFMELSGSRGYSYFSFISGVLKSSKNSFIYKNEVISNFLNDSKTKELDITEFITNDVKFLFENSFIKSFTASLLSAFPTLTNLENKYSDNSEGTEIYLNSRFAKIKIKIVEERLEVTDFIIEDKFLIKKVKRNKNLRIGASELVIYSKDGDDFESAKIKIIEEYSSLAAIVFSSRTGLLVKDFSGVHYLPASRSGLYQALSAFGQIIAELSRSRSFLSKKIELPGISEPVSDYFIKLSDIRVNKKSFIDTPLNSIAKSIEEKILGGTVEFDSTTKQLMFTPNKTQLRLELSSTSSMVSELAPVVSYLRYVLTKQESVARGLVLPTLSTKTEPKALIMIEEPEAHLHPEVQIALTEIFEQIIGSNIKLIVTSHSNYIFNKVNNLIMKNEINKNTMGLNKNNVCSLVFKKTDTGSVSHELVTDELGIEDNNFTDATESLFDEKMELFTNLNNEVEE